MSTAFTVALDPGIYYGVFTCRPGGASSCTKASTVIIRDMIASRSQSAWRINAPFSPQVSPSMLPADGDHSLTTFPFFGVSQNLRNLWVGFHPMASGC